MTLENQSRDQLLGKPFQQTSFDLQISCCQVKYRMARADYKIDSRKLGKHIAYRFLLEFHFGDERIKTRKWR